MDQENKPFEYNYSAKEQEELKRIREKYCLPVREEENKMEQLRRLDSGVTQKATAVSLIFGILGALVMGFGMSLAMTELGQSMGLGALSMVIGIPIGLAGLILAALAYPAYNRILRKERERIAPEILRLTDELMK